MNNAKTKKKNFSQLPNEVFNWNLTPTAFMIYAYLNSKYQIKDWQPNKINVRKVFKLGELALNNAWKELVQKGILLKNCKRINGKYFYEWTFISIPPICGNQGTVDSTDIDSPHLGDRASVTEGNNNTLSNTELIISNKLVTVTCNEEENKLGKSTNLILKNDKINLDIKTEPNSFNLNDKKEMNEDVKRMIEEEENLISQSVSKQTNKPISPNKTITEGFRLPNNKKDIKQIIIDSTQFKQLSNEYPDQLELMNCLNETTNIIFNKIIGKKWDGNTPQSIIGFFSFLWREKKPTQYTGKKIITDEDKVNYQHVMQVKAAFPEFKQKAKLKLKELYRLETKSNIYLERTMSSFEYDNQLRLIKWVEDSNIVSIENAFPTIHNEMVKEQIKNTQLATVCN